jgi:hypothetical protein
MQRSVLTSVLSKGGEVRLLALKARMFGRLRGDGNRLACGRSQAASLNRAIAGLQERGLVRSTAEAAHYRKGNRLIALTDAGREEAKRMQREVGA